MKSVHFEAPKHEPLDCEATVTNTVDETHEFVCHMLKKKLREVEHMPNLKNLASAQISKFFKPLFKGVRAFMHAANKGDAFLIYAHMQ
jgi:hypothetical protein